MKRSRHGRRSTLRNYGAARQQAVAVQIIGQEFQIVVPGWTTAFLGMMTMLSRM